MVWFWLRTYQVRMDVHQVRLDGKRRERQVEDDIRRRNQRTVILPAKRVITAQECLLSRRGGLVALIVLVLVAGRFIVRTV